MSITVTLSSTLLMIENELNCWTSLMTTWQYGAHIIQHKERKMETIENPDIIIKTQRRRPHWHASCNPTVAASNYATSYSQKRKGNECNPEDNFETINDLSKKTSCIAWRNQGVMGSYAQRVITSNMGWEWMNEINSFSNLPPVKPAIPISPCQI